MKKKPNPQKMILKVLTVPIFLNQNKLQGHIRPAKPDSTRPPELAELELRMHGPNDIKACQVKRNCEKDRSFQNAKGNDVSCKKHGKMAKQLTKKFSWQSFFLINFAHLF